ncbi:MAG: hypothetical protein RL189_2037 [Pseudomonadota bacterium]|jgi:hypothetical protein
MTSVISALLVALAALAVLSQFGRRLSAKHSLVWLSVFTFLLFAALVPEWLEPLARLAGFRLVSNFVLAGLILFAFLEILQQTTQTVKAHRKIRDLICMSAARRFLEKRQNNQLNTKILVVCPCYNEEDALPNTIKSLELIKQQHPDLEFCIVNDGSQDSSGSILRKFAPLNHAEHLSNSGVSGALLTGFLIARELGVPHVVQCDTDGQHPFEFITELVSQAELLQTDLMIGSRFVTGSDDNAHGNALTSTTWMRWIGGRLIYLTLALFGSRARIKDPTSGFRVYSERAYKRLISSMPEEYPEPESIALLSQAGLNIGETLVKMNARITGTSSLAGFRSAQFMIKVSIALFALRLRRIP